MSLGTPENSAIQKVIYYYYYYVFTVDVNLPVTVAEGFMSWMWKGLAFLLPFLFFGYVSVHDMYTPVWVHACVSECVYACIHAYTCGNMYRGQACMFVRCEQARFSLSFTY